MEVCTNIRIKPSKIGLGDHSSQGVSNFQKVLQWVDMQSRSLFNGEKILAL